MSKLEWQHVSIPPIKLEVERIVPITKIDGLTDEELIDNTVSSLLDKITENLHVEVDSRYALALEQLTRRQKRKLAKWLKKSIKKLL